MLGWYGNGSYPGKPEIGCLADATNDLLWEGVTAIGGAFRGGGAGLLALCFAVPGCFRAVTLGGLY